MDANHGGGAHLPLPAPAQALPAKSPDKSKRDEWSEGGVLCLLDVYESKWIVRNRAKLKGSDWEDIAHQVSGRISGIKGPKTPNQCKNKVESMKKRYRAEAAACNPPRSCSSWQYYTRMDSLLKGAPNCPSQPKCDNTIDLQVAPKTEGDADVEGRLQCSNHDDGSNTMPVDLNADNDEINEERKESRETDSDMDAGQPAKRRKGSGNEVAESIRQFGHSLLKIEEARMEMFKETEKIRADAEVKRAEMELKRTEIIARTQLRIAKLFMKSSEGSREKGESSSLGGGMDLPLRKDGMQDN